MAKFTPEFSSDPKYDKMVNFINKIFQNEARDNEEIIAEADVGWKCSNDIYITYKATRNKKNVWESYYLDPNLMCDLSAKTVATIVKELLKNWRGER